LNGDTLNVGGDPSSDLADAAIHQEITENVSTRRMVDDVGESSSGSRRSCAVLFDFDISQGTSQAMSSYQLASTLNEMRNDKPGDEGRTSNSLIDTVSDRGRTVKDSEFTMRQLRSMNRKNSAAEADSRINARGQRLGNLEISHFRSGCFAESGCSTHSGSGLRTTEGEGRSTIDRDRRPMSGEACSDSADNRISNLQYHTWCVGVEVEQSRESVTRQSPFIPAESGCSAHDGNNCRTMEGEGRPTIVRDRRLVSGDSCSDSVDNRASNLWYNRGSFVGRAEPDMEDFMQESPYIDDNRWLRKTDFQRNGRSELTDTVDSMNRNKNLRTTEGEVRSSIGRGRRPVSGVFRSDTVGERAYRNGGEVKSQFCSQTGFPRCFKSGITSENNATGVYVGSREISDFVQRNAMTSGEGPPYMESACGQSMGGLTYRVGSTRDNFRCAEDSLRKSAPERFFTEAYLGTYDGSTSLETFLARFENCAQYF
jgi:hypothetical protein